MKENELQTEEMMTWKWNCVLHRNFEIEVRQVGWGDRESGSRHWPAHISSLPQFMS